MILPLEYFLDQVKVVIEGGGCLSGEQSRPFTTVGVIIGDRHVSGLEFKISRMCPLSVYEIFLETYISFFLSLSLVTVPR